MQGNKKSRDSSRDINAVAEKAGRKPTTLKRGKGVAPRKGFVPPEDERGVPYPGDWPNPLAGKIRGCY